MGESNSRLQFGKLSLYHLTNPAFAHAAAGKPACAKINKIMSNLPELSTNLFAETVIAFAAFLIISGLFTLQILLKIQEVYAFAS